MKMTEERCKSVLKELGVPDKLDLRQINGESYFTLPGPIVEPVHPKMIPIREEPFFSKLDEEDRDFILGSSVYYIVHSDDLAKLFAIELTKQQRARIAQLIERQQ